MRSKFILTVAAGLLAGTIAAAAQQSGAPAGEKDRTGQPTDSEHDVDAAATAGRHPGPGRHGG